LRGGNRPWRRLGDSRSAWSDLLPTPSGPCRARRPILCMQAHARGKPEAEGGGRELALPAYGSYSLSQRGEGIYL
ncbi:hypothetical protein LINPERHAP1_LOCUS8062, partial [Linum perenne]